MGVTNIEGTIQKANHFINCGKMVKQDASSLSTLKDSINLVTECFEDLIKLGLPSPFLPDSAIMGIKQLLGLIMQKQHDLSSLQTLSEPLEEDESVALCLPLPKLLISLQLAYNEPKIVPFKDVSELDQSFQAR